MPKGLEEGGWIALRAEWEVSLLSDNELAKKYGISRGTLVLKRNKEGWKKDESLKNIVKLEAAKKVRERVKRHNHQPELEPEVQPGGRPVEAAILGETAMSKAQAMVAGDAAKERVLETAIACVTEASTKHLYMSAQLRDTFNRYHELIQDVLMGDPEQAGKALMRIMSSEKESLSSAISTMVKLAESIQKIERTALGLEERKGPTVNLQNNISQSTGVLSNDGDKPVINIEKFSTEQLAWFGQLAAALDEERGHALPLPPGTVIDG